MYTQETIKKIKLMFETNPEIDENDISIVPWFDDSIKDINSLTDKEVVDKYIEYYKALVEDLKALECTQLYDFFECEKIIDGENNV
jgi:hypothetical protein